MYQKFIVFSFFLLVTLCSQLYSQPISPTEPLIALPASPKTEEVATTEHKIQINGQTIEYIAHTGTLPLVNDKGTTKASLFFVAYFKKQEANSKPRPITFCFNGGPGAAAVWLHMGLLGPKRVALAPDAFTPPPYTYVDNDYSILDVTDLVFIDPVSTGYSRAASGEDPKQYYGVEEDIKAMGEFIHLFTTRFDRWDSPKYIIGESYGTTRAAGLAFHLIDQYKYYLNGILLISTVLNFQTIDFDDGNDLAYILALPSYTAAAWYHKKLAPEQQKDLSKTLQEVENFALNEYALALLQGDSLPENKRKEVANKLSKYTGLPSTLFEKAHLRIDISHFSNEILRDQSKIIGRFDSRYVGLVDNPWGNNRGYDPSLTALFGAFTGTFMDYVRKDLKWKEDGQYKVLTSLYPWNFGNATNCYLNMSEDLRNAMIRNPALRIYVASGFFDLATPYFATKYTFDHLKLNPTQRNNISFGYFDGGHMMYTNKTSLEKLKRELITFYNIDKN